MKNKIYDKVREEVTDKCLRGHDQELYGELVFQSKYVADAIDMAIKLTLKFVKGQLNEKESK